MGAGGWTIHCLSLSGAVMTVAPSTDSFSSIPVRPGEHFKLHLYGSVVRLLAETSRWLGSPEAVFEKFPFLIHYNDECAVFGLAGTEYGKAAALWDDQVRRWEEQAEEFLPLRALRTQLLPDDSALRLLMLLGLVEEDARFGVLFETLQGLPGQQRPTVGYLMSSWQGAQACGDVRTHCQLLEELGLVQVVNRELPRPQWTFRPAPLLWDAMRGQTEEWPTAWLRYRSSEHFASLDALILSEDTSQAVSRLSTLLREQDKPVTAIRGPQSSGRRSILGAVAKELGYSLLEVQGLVKPDDDRWHGLSALATLLQAMPVLVYDLGPGEVVELPRRFTFIGPVGLVLGKWGSVRGSETSPTVTLSLPMPNPSLRWQHWKQQGTHLSAELIDRVSEQYRLTGGLIRRTAERAWAYAQLDGRATVTLSDLSQASRALNRHVLEALATPLDVSGGWEDLVVRPHTNEELQMLALRCQARERLGDQVSDTLGRQLNVGVRALFSGPSGSGKTLAAKLLAAVLQKDLFRVDLSTVVNKYIGETEKNLNQLFTRAEELDVILLLDEGDALMAQRTDVHNSNDRYANFETNYLLQRLECFEGIVIVTTNAQDHIDSAFQRRMDVVVEFHPPDRMERLALWQLHLPALHQVSDSMLFELAHRCQLSGGQIRNAVLHASLLALQTDSPIASEHLEAAVLREYRKTGHVCPLRVDLAKAVTTG